MKTVSAYLVFLTFTFLAQTLAAEDLKVTTFNIEWYGAKDLTHTDLNSRDTKLKQFFKKYNYYDSDVMVFQEIVDTKRFMDKIMRGTHKCQSYKHSNNQHQHVVICYKSKYTFGKSRHDDNYTLESVAFNALRLRPAVHGILKQGNKELIRIFGVHLKAQPDQSETRITQVQELSKFLDNDEQALPTLILGDFNTYSDSNFDDVESISEVFAQNDLVKIKNNDEYTFRKHPYKNQFDHFWISNNIEFRAANTFPACQDNPGGNDEFYNIASYNKYISDHCPVNVELTLN